MSSPTEPEEKEERPLDEEIVVYPIGDTLDLHTFLPKEVKELVGDYLEAAWEKGYQEVRIIHGKGTGVLRKIVHSILSRHPLVKGFRQAEDTGGGWGATVVFLQHGSR